MSAVRYPVILSGLVSVDIPPSPGPGAIALLSWVPDREIPGAHRAFVAAHVRRLARRHKLGTIRVRYFGPPLPSGIHEVRGHYVDRGDFHIVMPNEGEVPVGVAPEDAPDTIGLQAGLTGDVLVHVIAHEIHHVIARRAGRETDEAAANRFADRYVLRRLGR